MQLSRLVKFHKMMGDPTRIRILALLAKGPKHGQALAGILGLTPPTITHHLNKLKELAIVRQKREKNTVYYYLDVAAFHHLSEASIAVIFEKESSVMKGSKEMEHQKVVLNYLTKDGKLKTIPSQRKKKLIILFHLANGLEAGKKYEEKEINKYIKNYHEDFATIRREFIMNHIMYRENGIYELNPKEMWSQIE
ncbi:DUF2087 domain-containing protein [Metabacillus arenae]|uniref:Metalloregulator ArsR/SmtB family transcription factor n=1 Tax=Metabacillus arenae TaxID=2771434 RepID=A0A926RWW4_9BACI|nr:metalloregulator ArsR/SmtB family transcription factor [Metabacillus arenae]MBD1380356.1 metalloregulator ArsR/SmtB family transcription factor [Metabacillus arenae]